MNKVSKKVAKVPEAMCLSSHSFCHPGTFEKVNL
jgi:hypothetical protein